VAQTLGAAKVMNLANFTQGRDNNYNLIRCIASLAVLFSHSYALAPISKPQPLKNMLGMTLGEISVDVFFITSGFLVTASLLYRKSIYEFIWARFLRIFPALFVMLLITVLVLGTVFTKLPVQQYLLHHDTLEYFTKSLTLFWDIKFTLPGVFNNEPINGSLWTMPFEVRMYAKLACTWFILGLFAHQKIKLFKIAMLLFALGGLVYLFKDHFFSANPKHARRLFFMFFSGASFYVLKDHIKISSILFFSLSAILLASTFNVQFFFVAYTLSIAYLLFYLAYIPKGFIRKFNLMGDYSYGIYIYAFPVQQTIKALMPNVSVLQMILISGTVTICLAVLSWHLLEKKVLGMKDFFILKSKSILNGIFKRAA
jgi:peptidoglycan/LPS O-acetylase OafA/YrhL